MMMGGMGGMGSMGGMGGGQFDKQQFQNFS